MKILRYAISDYGLTKMPEGEILRVGFACAWVSTVENAPLVERNLRIFSDFEEIPSNGWYRGSYEVTDAVTMEPRVYFVYEWMVLPP